MFFLTEAILQSSLDVNNVSSDLFFFLKRVTEFREIGRVNFFLILMKFFLLFKVVLRVGGNDSGVLAGEVSGDMSPPAFVRDEWAETTCTIHFRRLAAGLHFRPTLRFLYHRQLHRVPSK